MQIRPLNIGNLLGRASLILAIIFLCANSAQAETSDPLKCDFSGIGSPMITVKIENADLTGAELKIPRDYLMSRAIDGATRDALLLQVWKESFLPYAVRDARSADQAKKLAEGRADNMTILISALKDLDSIATLHLQFGYPAAGDANEKALQPVSGRLVTLENGFSGYRDQNGLLEQEGLPIQRLPELLVGYEKQEITDIFQCDLIGDVPFPFCTHIFESGAYNVQISYRRNDLPKWREFKEKAEQLLACLTTKQPKER
jgi:hypothetical protein